MKPKARDYKAEYRHRIKSGCRHGFSRAQASGHPDRKKGEVGISEKKNVALMVATNPCIGCMCTDTTPEECKKLEGWLKKEVKGQGRGVGVSV